MARARLLRHACGSMTSMLKLLGRAVRGVSCLAVLGAAGDSVAQPAVDRSAQLIGTWRGTSICADRVAAPGCRDETVVYEFAAGSQPGTVRWIADKIVNGERQPMGELELTFDETEACWKAEFNSPRARVVWRLVVDGSRLSGTGRQLPGNETIRKMDLRKDAQRQRTGN